MIRIETGVCGKKCRDKNFFCVVGKSIKVYFLAVIVLLVEVFFIIAIIIIIILLLYYYLHRPKSREHDECRTVV